MINPTTLRRYATNPQIILWVYLLLIAVAEFLTTPGTVAIGLTFHAVILIALLLHAAFERNEQVRRLTLALVLAPMIRLLSLSLPLGEFPKASWHPIVSLPLLISAFMIARQLRVTRRELRLQAGNPLIQFMLMGGGVTLGALEYAILSPKALLPDPTWITAGLTGLSLFVFTGFTEEIIFRGLLQSLALPVLRRWALIYVSLLFGAMHITYLSLADFIFVTAVGLVFAYIVLWSDSILGVTLAHGLTNVTLFVGLPYFASIATGPMATLIRWIILISTALWLIAFGAVMWRADIEGRLLLRDDPSMADEGARGMPDLRRSRAWQHAQRRVGSLGFAPRIQGTRAWRQLQSRGVVDRINRVPWHTLTPRVTTAFIVGGLFGILGSAGLLLAFGGGGGGGEQAAAPHSTNVAAVRDATPTSDPSGVQATTTPAVAALVPSPTTAIAGATEPTATPAPSVASTAQPSAVATVAPSETTGPAPAAVLAVSLPWPETLPVGMRYAATDSWPFRFVGPQQRDEPFLIFRDDARWMVLRDQPRDGHPVPASATREQAEVGDTTATLLRYADEGLQLIWEREGEPLQLSASGVSADDLLETANSLATLDPAAFEARLASQTTPKQATPSLLWPEVLPAGLVFQPIESVIEPQQALGGPANVEGYVLVFRSSTSNVTVGGGSIQAPPITGDEETVEFGQLTGRLITNDESFLLVVETTPGTLPHFDVLQEAKPALLPPVQQGPVFIAADNLSREDFEQVIAGLNPLSPAEFVPRSRGQATSSLTYMWPDALPAGFAVDPASVTFGWDDFLLQGGRPYFSITARNDEETIVLQGGRESSGAAFVIPEGEDVEQFFPTIRGQTATAARTADGSVVLWSENDVFYSITSPTLDVDTLASIAENVQRLDAEAFYDYLR
jgi:uncharacterized protein